MGKFSLGQIVATPGALAAFGDNRAAMEEVLCRHARGDWGEVCDDDKQANDRALQDGARVLSAYRAPNGEKVWVITEADRSVTTLLLPDEY